MAQTVAVDMIASAMKCPKCNNEMLAGKVYIGGGAHSLLFGGGISFGNLTIKADGWRDHIVQETSEVLPGYYCDRCGAVVVETTRIGLSTLES
jgi:hypothetical protein